MLVIRRREGEAILIGEDVEIEILEITPARVKLGIRAPDHVQVLRKELKATREQNLAAARGLTSDGLARLLRMLGR
ncbi:MAG TPA: carbon storage regulator [Bryobacteraceae bacterium]|nr:carbon storage regulator [Bryobacteraceae bacterium]